MVNLEEVTMVVIVDEKEVAAAAKKVRMSGGDGVRIFV